MLDKQYPTRKENKNSTYFRNEPVSLLPRALLVRKGKRLANSRTCCICRNGLCFMKQAVYAVVECQFILAICMNSTACQGSLLFDQGFPIPDLH
ncbi:hypothetical protein CDAR_518901 [Caerostris darwini]|uniref:Uncharacterized protein n=1 Tax=Caerostris darwini TaxID=1538125 RepID=A0AAV4PS88_9ARAC|nr:hypothetical protein CDAR_518901 [Caerostris darwini]